MIQVHSNNEGLNLTIYNLLREYFPSRENSRDKNILVDINDKFEIKINIDQEEILLKHKFSIKDKTKIKKDILLSLFSNIEISNEYGVLTGIRPTKLVRKLLQEKSIEETKKILEDDYLMSQRKIDELIDIVKLENNIFSHKRSNISLYFHIPFCPSICSYCSFTTYKTDKSKIDIYVDNLIKEFKSVNKEIIPTSIYIGGGTPTALDNYNLERLLYEIQNKFDINCEYTVECGRPDTIDEDKLNLLKNYGVNRISINPQTMKDETLKTIGRTHSTEDILNAYNLAKDKGFIINMDLIVGLPDETIDDVSNSLEKIIELNPENITVHSLSIKNGSRLFKENKFYSTRDSFDLIKNIMAENNYHPYYLYRQKRMVDSGENIGFSKKGFECIYNSIMIEEVESILGFGVSASTKILNRRNLKFKQYLNFRDLITYNSRVEEDILMKNSLLEEL